MQYEIDEFEKYENLLTEKVDNNTINIFKEYLTYKKEVIQKFRNMIFGRPLLEQKDAENLAYSWFYSFIRGISVTFNDKSYDMNYPPKVVLNDNINLSFSWELIQTRIEYIKETINFSFVPKAIKTCYQILNPDFKEIDAIPFDDLHLPEYFKNKLFKNDSSYSYQGEFGLMSTSTPILLQCIIFFSYFKLAFDSEMDALFYDLWLEFFEKTSHIVYDVSKNTFTIIQPSQEVLYIGNKKITIEDLKIN